MKILHYVLGIPPLRGGGAIKYAQDLAEGQRKLGHEASLIYPGEIRKGSGKVKIVRHGNSRKGILYEIINPLPVPLACGIAEPEAFMREGDAEVYNSFFRRERFDVLHIHSLMGMHREFLAAAKKQGVKVFYTTHDYFGLCPKTDLFRDGKICGDVCWKECGKCCAGADGIKLLVRRQSHLFQWAIRYEWVPRLKRKIFRMAGITTGRHPGVVGAAGGTDSYGSGGTADVGSVCSAVETDAFHGDARGASAGKTLAAAYGLLRQFYLEEFRQVDTFLYNSSVSKGIYERYIHPRKGTVIEVSHSGIQDNRCIQTYGIPVRLGYLGKPGTYKGYDLLIAALDRLLPEYTGRFTLTVFMEYQSYRRNYLIQKRPYDYRRLTEVYRDMDVLVVPSLWAETYGLVVSEAISYGVPVIVTGNVGACDLVRRYEGIGFIVEPEIESLADMLRMVISDASVLAEANRTIYRVPITYGYENYVRRILEIYSQELTAKD